MNLELDQHFLIDKYVLDLTIKEANITKEDIILEIGAGSGILTKELIKTDAKKIISIEKDDNLKEELNKIESDKLFVKFKDGVELFNKFNFTKLIANIPYSITEPLYTKILDKKITFAILLHGEKFYKHIKFNESKWHYFVNAYYNIELLKEVEGDSFEPKAKVKSVLLKLTLKENRTKEEKFYCEIFKKRKRNAKNAIVFALVDTYNLTKKEANEKIKDLEIPDKNLENLSNKEFIDLKLSDIQNY